jgi:hypothetical protein
VKPKAKILIFLLLTYGTSCIISSNVFTVFGLSDNSAKKYEQESSSFPSSFPLSAEQDTGSAETDSSEDDENFIDLSGTSLVISIDSRRFLHLNNSLLLGSLNLPFSPPEILSC